MEDVRTDEGLRSWAAARKGRMSNLATQLADALQSTEQAALWSLIDVRREFEIAAETERSKFQGIVEKLRVVLPITYLFPVAWTWWHLRLALDGYNNFSPGRGQSIDFLRYWSAEYSGMRLPDVALSVVISLVGIAVLHFAVNSRDDVELDAQLSELLLFAQLRLAKSRAVTPQELSDSMSRAAQLLNEAASTASTSLGNITTLAESMSGAANTLANVSDSLSISAQQIAYAVQPLIAIPETVNEAVQGLRVLPSQLAEVQSQIASSTSNLARAAESIRAIGQAHDLVAGQSQQLLDGLRDLNTGTNRSLDMISQAAEKIQKLFTYVESQEPSVVIMATLVEDLKLVYGSMNSIAEEFKAAADMFQQGNEANRRG